MPKLLDDLCDLLGKGEETLADAQDTKDEAEGILGKLLVGRDFVRDTADLGRRLKAAAESGQPPGTLRFLKEVGSYIVKDRRG